MIHYLIALRLDYSTTQQLGGRREFLVRLKASSNALRRFGEGWTGLFARVIQYRLSFQQRGLHLVNVNWDSDEDLEFAGSGWM